MSKKLERIRQGGTEGFHQIGKNDGRRSRYAKMTVNEQTCGRMFECRVHKMNRFVEMSVERSVVQVIQFDVKIFYSIVENTRVFNGDVDDVRQFEITYDFPMGCLMASTYGDDSSSR